MALESLRKAASQTAHAFRGLLSASADVKVIQNHLLEKPMQAAQGLPDSCHVPFGKICFAASGGHSAGHHALLGAPARQ